MYKLLLIWRYLLTRYIALVCVISVMLGVATMIVVNAVMLGFSREMETRIHGVLSDVTVCSQSSLRGFDNLEQRILDVKKVVGDRIEAVTPTVTTPGLLSFEVSGGEVLTRQVQIIGIDEVNHEKVTAISRFLQHPENRKHLSFNLREDGYQASNPLFGSKGIFRPALEMGGWKRRRSVAKIEKIRQEERIRQRQIVDSLKRPQSDFDPIVNDSPIVPTLPPAENNKGTKDPSAVQKESIKTPGNVTKNVLSNPAESVSKNSGNNPNTTSPDNIVGVKPDSQPGLPKPIAETQKVDPYVAALKNLPSPPKHNIDPIDDRPSSSAMPAAPPPIMDSPLDKYEQFQIRYNKESQQETGIIVGVGMFSGYRRRTLRPDTNETVMQELMIRVPGDDVTLSMLAVGAENSLPRIVYDRFTVTDLYECQMAEYDESFVYVPIKKLQFLRGMIDSDGTTLATHLLIKVKPGVSINEVRDALQASPLFPDTQFEIKTWRDQQAVMLAAVATELSILNVLLFLIIAVAGFGILAIFFMIVVEKTRDIGIMKSLGAGGSGIMQIFLGYGLVLGLLGSGLGLGLGLLFVHNINKIAAFLSKIMGHEVFDPAVYSFNEVPAIVEPATVINIMLGSILIAVLAGILPAWRAARLNPIDALRV